MSQSEIGKDGAYRMTIENRYKQLAGVRRDSKLLSVLAVSMASSTSTYLSCKRQSPYVLIVAF